MAVDEEVIGTRAVAFDVTRPRAAPWKWKCSALCSKASSAAARVKEGVRQVLNGMPAPSASVSRSFQP